jgi:hypothetical protein
VNRDPLDKQFDRAPGRIVLTGARGKGFRAAGDALYVPKGTKLLTLDKGLCDCGSDSEPPPALQLGNLADLHLGILKHAGLVGITLRSDGVKFSIDEGARLDEEDAVVDLVVTHGLREKAARQLLDQTRKSRVREAFLAYPEGHPLEKSGGPPYELQRGGPSAPYIPEPVPHSDEFSGGLVPATESYRMSAPVPELQASLTDRSIYEPYPATQHHMVGGTSGGPPAPDQQSLSTALDAARTGQKEVFDTAVIGSIIGRSRVDSVLDDKLVSSSLKQVDQLGKALMHLYYNKELWEDRFGKAEIPDLEDMMRSTFEDTGDLALRLHEKTVKPGPDEGVLPELEGGVLS